MAAVRLLTSPLLFSAVALLLTAAPTLAQKLNTSQDGQDTQQDVRQELEQLSKTLGERLDNCTKSTTAELWQKEVELQKWQARSQAQEEEIAWLRSLVAKIATLQSGVETTSPPSIAFTDDRIDCLRLFNEGTTSDGVYQLRLPGSQTSFQAYCDMTDGGGWMRILVRQVHHLKQLGFKKSFAEYQNGFGDPKGEYWVGNDILHALTHNAPHILRVRVLVNGQDEFLEGKWSTFMVGTEESQYTLTVGGYDNSTSTLQDALTDSNGRKFVTIDRNASGEANSGHCVRDLGGGGWWYGSNCFEANPTGPFSRLRGGSISGTFWSGDFPGGYFSSENIIMKIRPRS